MYLYGRNVKQSMDQPGNKVTNPARGQLIRENEHFTTGSVVPPRASLIILILHTQPDLLLLLLMVLAHGIPPAFRGGVHLFGPPTAMRHWVSPEFTGHTNACRWRSLARVHRHRASSPQGCSSNGCCLFRHRHGPINIRLSFPTPTVGM